MVDFIPSSAQAADIFTKVLRPLKYHKCMQLLGLRNSYEIERKNKRGFLVSMPHCGVSHITVKGIYK